MISCPYCRFTDQTKWSQLNDENLTEADTSSPVYKAQLDASQDSAVGLRSSILFNTKFANNTNDVQEYTMRADKTTRSSIATSIESGFTRGIDMSVKLSSPGQVCIVEEYLNLFVPKLLWSAMAASDCTTALAPLFFEIKQRLSIF